MVDSSTLELDGGYGEGGGQVLRTALALSMATGRSFRMHSIRANRRSPGLAPQHLACVLACAELSGAEVRGAKLGSREVRFTVGKGISSQPARRFDVSQLAGKESAGSVTLLLQSMLVPLALSGGATLTLLGGTHVPWSPPFEYLQHVFLPTVREMGLVAHTRLESCGFYPAGGGRIQVEIAGLSTADDMDRITHPFTPLRLRHRGRLQEIRGRAVVANLPGHIAERMARTATRVLAQRGMKSQITADRVDSRGRGAAIYMTARYQHSVAGFSAIGRRGVPSEAVAEEACRRLLTHDASGAPIDPHLADQLLLPAAFSKGPVSFECSQITQHLTTAAHIISRFLSADVRIAGEANQPGTVTVGPNVRRTS